MITSIPPLVLRSCRSYDLGELADSRVLFLREQVSDLRVQEFLWELVVGVVALSDLARSILVEILHSVEGGDIEKVCSNLETINPYLQLLISLSLVFYILHAYIVHLFICLIYLCLF